MPVQMMLASMSPRELLELQVFYRLKAEERQEDDLARQSEAGVRQMGDD